MTFKVGRLYKDANNNYYIFITGKEVTRDVIVDKDDIVYSFYYLDLPDEIENMWEREIYNDWIEV